MNDLARLAEDCGVLTHHVDGFGRDVVPPEATLLAVLRALDVDIEHAGDAGAVLAARHARAAELCEPGAVVAADDGSARVPVALADDELCHVVIRAEDGSEHRAEARGRDLEGEPGRRRLPVGALPAGYHELELGAGDRTGRCHIIAAPERCYGAPDGQRRWGVFAPVYALRSADDLGAGDLGDLRRLLRFTSDRGGSFVGTLPLLAADYQSGEVSPYSPVSRLFFGELFVDHRALSDRIAGLPELLAEPELRARAAELRATELVDYQGKAELVRRVLEHCQRALFSDRAGRARIEAFLARRPEVDDYARFRAALASSGRPWPEWSPAARDGTLDRDPGTDDDWRYHVVAQLLLDEQLEALADTGAGLYLDLPVGVSGHSYDLWRYRDAFAEMITVGAPPDELFSGGQNWALPPLHPERARRRGHDYFIASIRAHMRHASMLRVDHVMGLHRLYWVPAHAPATDGAYVCYQADELYAILAVESHRNQCAVAGEDLGTVPDYVRPMMDRRGVHRLFVGQFCTTQTDDGLRIEEPPPSAIASLDTHDTATFATFAQKAELGDPAAAMRQWTLDLAASPAAAVLVTLEDLWLETTPQNVPGTTADDYPSWRHKLARDLGSVESSPDIQELLAAVSQLRGR